jgi:hypothetical protein
MLDTHTIHIKNIRKDPSDFELAFWALIAVRWAAMRRACSSIEPRPQRARALQSSTTVHSRNTVITVRA